MLKLFRTDDGSMTAFHSELGEMYHSSRGAVGEAMHVYIEAALRYYINLNSPSKIRVFDMGFGTGLNAWLTFREILNLAGNGSKPQVFPRVEYCSIEKYPLSLDETMPLKTTDAPEFIKIMGCPWNHFCEISDFFSIMKINGDVLDFDFSGIAPLDVVFWDAFAPIAQPDLWSDELFARVYESMSRGGVLVTYSSKGTVKQALKNAGFRIERLPGALGKHHMLRAYRD